MSWSVPRVNTDREAVLLQATRMIYNRSANAFDDVRGLVGEETAVAMVVMFLTAFYRRDGAEFPMPEGGNAWVYLWVAALRKRQATTPVRKAHA